MLRQPLLVITAAALLATCRSNDTTAPPTPSALASVSGTNQSGTVGQTLAQALVVIVDDQHGNPMSGASVAWTVTSGGGNVSTAAGLTDAQGHASVTWALGPTAGTQTVTAGIAGVAGSPVQFSATAQPGPASALGFATQPAATAAGVVLAPAITVIAHDALGNTTPAFTGAVTLSVITDPGGSPFGGTSSVSAVTGVATFSTIAIATVGCYRLVAGAGGLQAATSASFCITSGAAAALAFAVQPTASAAGVAITPAVQVIARDAFGNGATTFTGAVTLTTITDPGGTPVGGGTRGVAAVAGVATFPGVSLTAVGCYRLVVTSTGLAADTSDAFCVIAAPAAALVFTTLPSNTPQGSTIVPAIAVRAQDAFGNPATTFTGNVTLAIAANPAGGVLSGTLITAAVAGVATFGDISIDKGGSGYTLRASSGTLTPDTSAAFTVAGPPPVILAFTTQPTGSGAGAGTAAVVTARDTLGATLTSFTAAVTVSVVHDPAGTPTGIAANVNAVAGVATFSGLAVDTVGCYKLVATATGASTATSGAFCISAGSASRIVSSGGNNQTAQIGTTLPTPYSVTVTDAFGNAVSGVTIDWAVTAGGGSMNPPQNTTGASGVAASTHTLGATPGAQTATATSTGLTGSPVTFTTTATSPPAITSITPDTLVEGQSATLTGTGFSATPASNSVLVGGVSATVNTASPMSLTITVPSSSCQPARNVGVSVTVASVASNTVTERLHPAGLLNLAVGQQVIVQNPSQFCLQLRPSATGGDAYLVGVGAAAETPTSTLPFALTSVTGAPGLAAPFPVRPFPFPATSGTRPIAPADLAQLTRQQAQMAGEQVIRSWEQQHLRPSAFRRPAPAPAPGNRVVQAVPSVGDTLQFRVADFSAVNPCASFTTITTVVRAVGSAGIWVTDTANPTLDSLTAAEIQGYSDTFDLKIFANDTLYFGAPTDLDNNQRILIVLTIQVNKDPLGIAGFVFGGDLFDRSVCNQSNGGEIFYGHVPDPGNAAGTGARTKASVLEQMPALIAHEFTHDIQISRRLLLGASTFMSSWEMEGQAVLADEVVGHSVLGNTTGQDYGATVAFGSELGNRWYAFGAAGAFQALPEYFGWLPPGSSSKAVNAPELCTLFGTTSLSTPCNPFAFYGASWSLQRYMADRFGPTYPGGETALNHDLIGRNVNLAGTANIAALLGVQFDSLLSQWGAMLYADNRVGGLSPALQMTSWNLFDVMGGLPSDAFRLLPASRTFAAFTDNRSVRGGSNAYTLISAAGARPALALRVHDAGGAVLGSTLKPQLWIVRIQ